jgi:hypothetical protein
VTSWHALDALLQLLLLVHELLAPSLERKCKPEVSYGSCLGKVCFRAAHNWSKTEKPVEPEDSDGSRGGDRPSNSGVERGEPTDLSSVNGIWTYALSDAIEPVLLCGVAEGDAEGGGSPREVGPDQQRQI